MFNHTEYMGMVGFSCYTFEGIGVVMPIMQACDCPEIFDKILLYALVTLTVVYCLFANYCYLVIGSDLDTSFITQELDQSSIIVSVLQIMMCINLVCSYAIFIYPTNTIIEDYAYKSLSKRKDSRSKKMYYYVQNFSRLLVCLFATYGAIELGKKLDKFLSVLGALLCAPLAITYPALIHMRVVAKTPKQKLTDLALVVLSLVVLVFSTMQSLA